jgi:hypothetical protein
MGAAATGKRVAVAGINIVRVSDNRIAEIWHVEDLMGRDAAVGDQPRTGRTDPPDRSPIARSAVSR